MGAQQRLAPRQRTVFQVGRASAQTDSAMMKGIEMTRTNSVAKRKQLIDLGHTVEDGMITYKGMPGPVISDYRSRETSTQFYAPGTAFHIGKIEMVANTGTYVDAPFHRFPEGNDLSELPLESLADLPGIRISTQGRAVHKQCFERKDLAGKAILVHTGWSRYWRTQHYFDGTPFLTQEAAEFLVSSRVALVGIDSMNIDDPEDGTRPVHTALLRANIPVVEHLTDLEKIPAEAFRFFAVPVKVKSFGSFPVRAFAIIE
jgi:arylformamidase